MWCLAGLGAGGPSIKNIAYHLFADDIQLHFSFQPYRLSRLLDYLKASRDLTVENVLQLNADITEVLIVALQNVAPMTK